MSSVGRLWKDVGSEDMVMRICGRDGGSEQVYCVSLTKKRHGNQEEHFAERDQRGRPPGHCLCSIHVRQ